VTMTSWSAVGEEEDEVSSDEVSASACAEMHIAQLTANVQRDVTLFGIADLPMGSSLRSGIPRCAQASRVHIE
jgi:hypothetical protein